MRSSPSFFKKLLVTLTTTASIGMSASNVTYARAEALTGQRLRAKLFATNTQKCANFCTRESLASVRSVRSSHNAWAFSRNRWNLEGLLAMTTPHLNRAKRLHSRLLGHRVNLDFLAVANQRFAGNARVLQHARSLFRGRRL